jgi:hypothetical protein
VNYITIASTIERFAGVALAGEAADVVVAATVHRY